jgi:type IV pilus assembly protein PilQ
MNTRIVLWMVACVLVCPWPVSAEVLYRSSHATLPGSNQLVSLDADDAPLSAALSLIALQVGINVIVSPGVEGTISIHLADVPFFEALNALTAGRDISFFTSGDVVVIAPKSDNDRVGMSTLAFRLRHLRPEGIIQATKTLMSADGQAVPLIQDASDKASAEVGGAGQEGAQPVIIFRDYPNVLAELERSLTALDVPQQQVEIQVKFMEARSNDLRNLGIEWSTQIQAGVGGAGGLSVSGSGSGSDETSSESESFSYLNDLNTGDFAWGTLGITEVRAVINYLVETGNGKIVSQPKVSVMDNELAEIKVTSNNPVQTLNRFTESAATADIVTYQYIETGIKLLVRPRVSDDGFISLSVNPIFEEIVGFVGPAESPAPVTVKREVTTTVKVKSGETLLLGGLSREREIETVRKVWLLGDIPILGELFRSTRTESEQTELMIMITPTVLPLNQ